MCGVWNRISCGCVPTWRWEQWSEPYSHPPCCHPWRFVNQWTGSLVPVRGTTEGVVCVIGLVLLAFLHSLPDIIKEQTYLWPGLQKQDMWAQTTPCLSKGHISTIEQNIFCSVTWITMPNKFAPSAEMLYAIACWDKKLRVQKDWKSRQNHVPTCPVFAGPVTFTDFCKDSKLYFVRVNWFFCVYCFVPLCCFCYCTSLCCSVLFLLLY